MSTKKSKTTKSYKAPNPPVGVIVHPIYAKCSTNILNRDAEENTRDVSRNGESLITRSLSTRSSLTAKLSNFIRRSDRCKTTLTNKKTTEDKQKHEKVNADPMQTSDFLEKQCLKKETTSPLEAKPPSSSRCEETCAKVTNGNSNTSSLIKDHPICQTETDSEFKPPCQRHRTSFKGLKYLPVGKFLKLLKPVPERQNFCPKIGVTENIPSPQDQNITNVQITQWSSELDLNETNSQTEIVKGVIKEASKNDTIENLGGNFSSESFSKSLLQKEILETNSSDISTIQVFSGKSETEFDRSNLFSADQNICVKSTGHDENNTLSPIEGILELSEEEIKSTVVVVSENSRLFPKVGKSKFNRSEIIENCRDTNLDETKSSAGTKSDFSLKVPSDSVEFEDDSETSTSSEIPTKGLAVVFITTDDNTIRNIKKQTSAFAYDAQDKNNIECSIITVLSDTKYKDTSKNLVPEDPECEDLKSGPNFSTSISPLNSESNSKIEVLQVTNNLEQTLHEKIEHIDNNIYTNSRQNINNSDLFVDHSQQICNNETKNISLLEVSCNSNQVINNDVSTVYTSVQSEYLSNCKTDKNYNTDVSQKNYEIEVPFLQNAQSSPKILCDTQNNTNYVDVNSGSLETTTQNTTQLQNHKDLSIIEIVDYTSNISYREPEINRIQIYSCGKNSNAGTDFNNNSKNSHKGGVLSEIEESGSLKNSTLFQINNNNCSSIDSNNPESKKVHHSKEIIQESQQNQDQPKSQTITFKESFRNCNSSEDEVRIRQISYNKVNHNVSSVVIDDELLDFGERLSCTTLSESLSGDINECYNVKLDAPEEFIVAGFHDFCHTMLSIEDSSLEPYDTGTIKKRPEKPTVNPEMQNSCPSTENVNNFESTEINDDGKSSKTGYQSDFDLETVEKANTFEKSKITMDELFDEIHKSKIMEKPFEEKDADVIEAIQVLDMSFMDSQETSSDISCNFSNQQESENPKRQNNVIIEVKSRSRIPKDDKIQCDNLIEELMLEDTNKRILDSSSVTLSSNSVSRGIAVTISNRTSSDEMCRISSPDFNKKQYTSDSNQTATKSEAAQPSEEFIDYEKESHTLGEMVCAFSSQTGMECNFNSPSSSMETMSIASTTADDVKQNIECSEMKEDAVSLPVSFTSEEHSPDALPSSPLQVSLNNSPMSHSSQDVVACHRTSPCSVDSGTSSHNQGYFVVVAIDFGTTYSGYAFSFTRDSDNIHMMKKWDGGDPGVFNQKTPTTLLLTPEGAFHSFGYSARDYYHDLDTEEAKRWLYFDKFKMALHHSEHLSLNTEIPAANGRQMLAVDVFAHALRYFKDHALQELSDQSATKILNEDVRWVVTVPAIWKQPAKQFMRAAAYNAGIASPEFSDQLLIALEPEAASIYCRKMQLHQLVPDESHIQKSSFRWSTNSKNSEDQNGFNDRDTPNVPILQNQHTDSSFNVGTRYMVVDCGGGTVDITVHEILDKHGTLKELQKATGGPYGSMGVDIEFEKLLCDIFSTDFIQQFKVKRPTGFVDLMVAFEARKRNASPYKSNPLNISLPFSFIDYFKKYKGSSVESAIKKSSHKDVKWSSQGMLRLEQSAMERLFHQTVKQIREHIESIIFLPELNIDHLFLVGGFAESLILQKEIKDSFSTKLKVIIPQGVSLAILKGAVLFGLDPTIVNIRRLRMTYGVGVLNRFIHGVHPKDKLVIKDGIQWCADIFDKFVVTDQSVGLGDVVVRSYTPAKAGQSCSVIHIYCSEKDNVYFITDPGVKRCGTLILDLSDSRYVQSREIQTRMMFGDTEIKVTALDVTTGKCVKSEINFLSH